jgi:enterochelin esterase family protein
MTVAERARDHVHPLIAALAADPSGAAAFWERIAQERTPLIEPDPASPGHSLVTFVFPAEDSRHVVVLPGYEAEQADTVMDRVAGTNICHASFRYRDDVRTHYSFAPGRPLANWRDSDEAEWRAHREFALASQPLPDPHHRAFSLARGGEGQPDQHLSRFELPDAPDQSIADKREGASRGHIERHMLKSEVLGNERRVWVYTPPGYDPARRYPVLVAFDGGAALTRTPTHRVLDNLIADGRIRPAVAILVDNATATSRNTELPCSEPFARFIETELMPWARGAYAISEDPKDAFVTGVSYGGLASMWLGYRMPQVFGNVIAQAPSLWWGPGVDLELPMKLQTDYQPEWLTARYAEAERLPLRIWMEIGLMESPEIMVEPNRRMRALLEAKGYDLTYSEPTGGHDYAVWRGTLPKALEMMLGPD